MGNLLPEISCRCLRNTWGCCERAIPLGNLPAVVLVCDPDKNPSMNPTRGAEQFLQLFAENKARYITINRQLAGLARDHEVPSIFARRGPASLHLEA